MVCFRYLLICEPKSTGFHTFRVTSLLEDASLFILGNINPVVFLTLTTFLQYIEVFSWYFYGTAGYSRWTQIRFWYFKSVTKCYFITDRSSVFMRSCITKEAGEMMNINVPGYIKAMACHTDLCNNLTVNDFDIVDDDYGYVKEDLIYRKAIKNCSVLSSSFTVSLISIIIFRNFLA